MEQLVAEQEITFSLIKKAGINFKKTPRERWSLSYIETRLQTLEEHWESYKSTHKEITKLSTATVRNEHKYFTEDLFSKGQEEYIDVKSAIKEKLPFFQRSPSVERATKSTISKTEVKLPKINLPQFNGSYNDWCTFRDLYKSLIHDNVSLSKVQKLHYLKSSLTGEPEQLLKHIQINEVNYDVAWETLTKRYNNKRIIVNAILTRLLSQKKLNAATAKGIKELLDTTEECLNNLKNNEIDIKNWDVLIIHLMINKLDSETHKSWEEEVGSLPVDELPSLNKFSEFLQTKFRVLEMVQPSTSYNRERFIAKPKTFLATSPVNTFDSEKCAYCNDNHRLFMCKEFSKLSVDDRVQYVQKQNLCFNCLSPKHAVKYCKNKGSCHECNKRHHSLLHFTRDNNENAVTPTPREPEKTEAIPVMRTHLTTQGQNALLATALVNIDTGKGLQLVRALIDPCSQESFISEATAQKLQLRKKPIEGHVTGVDQMSASIKFSTNLEISSRVDVNFKTMCTAYVVKQVTDILPSQKINRDQWPHLQNLTLADPTYHKPGSIDMLLGVNVYTEILMSGIIRGEPGSPIAQQSRLGWIISGGVKDKSAHGIVSMHLNVSLDTIVQKFWDTEKFETDEIEVTHQEQRAEDIYEKTVKRDPSGRYIVALPFKTETPILPENSKEIAIKRLQSLERKLSKNEKLREEYNNVMSEYLTLNHMEEVREKDDNEKAVYLPHHAVIRGDKETTKVRTVFDASCKGDNGVSLNDQLLIGASLQEELRDILLRWRIHKIGFIADVIKMYRQILMRREDTDFQRIVWRFNTNEEIKEYRLLTVTFGLACAPYLAIKTLKQIAKDEGKDNRYKRAREIINNDVYMDDILSGSHDDKTAIELQKRLTEMLRRGGFELQKWVSDSETFMQEIEPEKRAKFSEVDINRKETIKALGVTWNMKRDELQVTSKVDILSEKTITKRNVLSVIASLFDPMGWLAPTVVMAKIFMQKLWKLELTWDEELPSDCAEEWIKYRSQIQDLAEIRVPRWIGVTDERELVELHGFSDASTVAYAAVVYCRVLHLNGEITTSLLMAKTRVAPVKKITLPRLELSAALLLSKLLKHVATAIKVKHDNTYAWSDSQITLAWIKGDPTRWKTYVRNRVLEINKLETRWAYVNTKENPADLASRGALPEKLKMNDMWWRGPKFLHEREIKLPEQEIPETEMEMREPVTCAIVSKKPEDNFVLTLLQRYSSLKKLLAIVAYCRRWLHLKHKKEIRKHLPQFVTHEEREEALTVCLRLSQEIEFEEDMRNLKEEKQLKRSSRLIALNPFVDDEGVLRVGGRLKHADIEFINKHPIIISNSNVLLPLLLKEAHLKTLHGGPQMMTTYLRGKYWLIKAGNTVKRFVRNCMRCARQTNINRTQLMGDLPQFRVRPSRPFSTSGVDFAGPIQARMSKGRGAKSFKAYITIFICMATKAIHIELVSDMTTEAFMAAFRRFVSRRGICKEMWSDNGTTFVSAQKELLEMWKQGQTSIPDELVSLLDREGTKWKFIPPGAPNFGGLWEAGVKSIKFHMKRTIGDSKLTFEEMSTLLTQIEACLNSRPLSPLSDHINDFEPLTPAHFLVGEPLVTVPERDYKDVNMHSLTRWQTIQKMLQNFWRKWQTEFMTRLQERPKWTQVKKEFDVGDLVLIKDMRYPPSKWLLGRIVEKHPGQDNITRAYDVRTNAGVFTRAVSKLCPLPDVKGHSPWGGVC